MSAVTNGELAVTSRDYDAERYSKDKGKSYTKDAHHQRTRHVPNSFQQLDYVPIISIVSAIFRAVIGAFQVGIGIFTFVFEVVYDWTQITNHRLLLVEGFLNIGRACYVWIPVIGNTIAYLYDRSYNE